MSVFISSLNVPIGYTTPPFPSLFWPLGKTEPLYAQSVLYYSFDVWQFTVIWFIIIFVGVYSVAGSIAVLTYVTKKDFNLRHIFNIVPIAGTFFGTGLLSGFVCGSIVGLIVLAVYKAGSMTVSTWIPFSWALVGILYDICTSYLTSQITL